jgi:hypothetical protein
VQLAALKASLKSKSVRKSDRRSGRRYENQKNQKVSKFYGQKIFRLLMVGACQKDLNTMCIDIKIFLSELVFHLLHNVHFIL